MFFKKNVSHAFQSAFNNLFIVSDLNVPLTVKGCSQSKLQAAQKDVSTHQAALWFG